MRKRDTEAQAQLTSGLQEMSTTDSTQMEKLVLITIRSSQLLELQLVQDLILTQEWPLNNPKTIWKLKPSVGSKLVTP